MTHPVQIWHCAAYFPVYRCGGWAFVRQIQSEAQSQTQGQIFGVAGGDRHTTARRVALLGLVAALKDLSALKAANGAISIIVQTNSLELYAYADVLAAGLETTQSAIGAPVDDLDLWAQIAIAAKGRRLKLVRETVEPHTPLAFASAWAELGRDKAKAAGAFTAPIPKINLAKIKGL